MLVRVFVLYVYTDPLRVFRARNEIDRIIHMAYPYLAICVSLCVFMYLAQCIPICVRENNNTELACIRIELSYNVYGADIQFHTTIPTL